MPTRSISERARARSASIAERGRGISRASASERVRVCRPMSTLSSTVRPLNTRTPWKVRAMPSAARRCAGRPLTSEPERRIVPPSAGTTPEMRLTSVVFPAPFGPMRPSARPWTMPRSTRSTAVTPPNRFVRPTVSSNIERSDARKAPRSANVDERHQAARQIDDDEQEDRALEDIAVILQRAQELGQRGEQTGAEDRPQDVRGAANHGEDQHLHGLGEAKVRRIDGERLVRRESSGPAGDERADHERRELVTTDRDPLARGRDLVFPDRRPRAPDGRSLDPPQDVRDDEH